MTEAGVYYQLRDWASLVEAGRRGIASNPNEWVEHYSLAVGYEGTGKLLEAISEYQKAVEMSDGDQDAAASLAHAYAVIGKNAEAQKILRDLQEKSRTAYVSPYIIATIYAGLSEQDRAFDFLERAYRERSLEMSWHIKADLRIDSLRPDSRFHSLLSRMDLRN
jgi:tetratricopeptide (TPR) repeat protein